MIMYKGAYIGELAKRGGVAYFWAYINGLDDMLLDVDEEVAKVKLNDKFKGFMDLFNKIKKADNGEI